MVLFLWWVPFFLSAQTTKGVVESSDHVVTAAPMGEAYALIVGVSNYPYVKPLNFAEEDALLFFEFLRSNAGGNIPENHIKLLLNEQATHANVTAGLAWLNNSVGAQPKAGDRVYIYLSGHGDAYDASEAYYLCYDSNPAGDKNNYQLGGALDIGKMKKRVAAMVSKGLEVILIVDACRSGDVPGVRSGIGNPYQSINPVVLATLVNQCSFFEDANLTEEMMNILIPYAFQSESQDYSTAISYIHAYFFLKTKRGDDRRNSAAYKNLLTKFVVQ